MKTFSFQVLFGNGPKLTRSASFSLDLNEQEIAYIKEYLEINGDECGYEDIEFDNTVLFDKINDAANDAVVKEINRHRIKKIDFFDIDWARMQFDFCWPDELKHTI